MNFGQKFPYALLTFSQSLSKLVIGYTLSQKLVRLIVPRTHTFSQKFVEAGYWVHYTPIITRTPSSTSTPYPTPTPTIHQLYTHHTPTIHNPTTPPIPLLLRVDSDEMWQKPVGFWLMRHWNARERPRSGRPRSGHRASYKQGVRPVCCERGRANEGG